MPPMPQENVTALTYRFHDVKTRDAPRRSSGLLLATLKNQDRPVKLLGKLASHESHDAFWPVTSGGQKDFFVRYRRQLFPRFAQYCFRELLTVVVELAQFLGQQLCLGVIIGQ